MSKFGGIFSLNSKLAQSKVHFIKNISCSLRGLLTLSRTDLCHEKRLGLELGQCLWSSLYHAWSTLRLRHSWHHLVCWLGIDLCLLSWLWKSWYSLCWRCGDSLRCSSRRWWQRHTRSACWWSYCISECCVRVTIGILNSRIWELRCEWIIGRVMLMMMDRMWVVILFAFRLIVRLLGSTMLVNCCL